MRIKKHLIRHVKKKKQNCYGNMEFEFVDKPNGQL